MIPIVREERLITDIVVFSYGQRLKNCLYVESPKKQAQVLG